MQHNYPRVVLPSSALSLDCNILESLSESVDLQVETAGDGRQTYGPRPSLVKTSIMQNFGHIYTWYWLHEFPGGYTWQEEGRDGFLYPAAAEKMGAIVIIIITILLIINKSAVHHFAATSTCHLLSPRLSWTLLRCACWRRRRPGGQLANNTLSKSLALVPRYHSCLIVR